jgi:hypothetical protein
MSHAEGAIKVKDRLYWVEYNGTVDVLLPRIYDTQDELFANWRRRDWPPDCSCSDTIDVRVAVTYGRGFSWLVTLCLTCKRVVGPLSNFYECGYELGLPNWYPNRELHLLKGEK